MNGCFDKIFCINLKRRTDRLAQAKAEFKKHNIDVEFIEAVNGLNLNIEPTLSKDGSHVSKGDVGCTLSHLKIAKIAKSFNLYSYFVFEDDCELIDNFNELFQQCYMQVPSDWDLLYLGGNHQAPLIHVMPNISKTVATFTTHSYAVKNTVYDALINEWERKQEKVDVALCGLHSKCNTYVTQPHLAWQRESFSDILMKEVNYKFLKK